ncbi:MAG: hypothetical protein IPM79_04320 [Polyangiaceae bacterium]|nr:hypothetical protein [Polyangiaceae bacterium]
MTKLVLDTSVVRGPIEDGSLGGLEDFKADGGSVHVADGTMVEVLSQLHAGQIAWADWVAARASLEALVDRDVPVMLGAANCPRSAGLALHERPPTHDRASQERLNRDSWRTLMSAQVPKDVGLLVGRLGRHAVWLRLDNAPAQVERERSKWMDQFRRFGEALDREGGPRVGRHVSEAQFEAQVQRLGEFIDAKTSSHPLASVRLDAMIRVHVLLHARFAMAKDRYNPVKHANDVFDVDLYRYLALPAGVCTRDRGIIADLEAANTFQRSWVATPDELLDAGVRCRLLNMRWPHSARRAAPEGRAV